MSLGYVYDPIYLEHDTGEHPENGARLVAIMDHLRDSGLLTRMTPLAAERAALVDLQRIHQPALIERIRRVAASGGGNLDLDTAVSARSFEAALFAAGGTIAAARAVLAGQVQRAFALVRPPGHHALAHRAMGFCLFNNIAVAAAWALAEGGVSRLAIVDFDVHHGNGTQAAFDGDPRVLFASPPQYPYFPGTGDWRDDAPLDRGGHCLNIPLPARTGDAGYRQAFEQLIVPAVRRHRPELIVVSAGYDAHWADPISWMRASLAGYRFMADALAALSGELCQSRLVMALEGGYHLQVLAHGVATTCCAMLSLPSDDPFGPDPNPRGEVDVTELLNRIAEYHGLKGR